MWHVFISYHMRMPSVVNHTLKFNTRLRLRGAASAPPSWLSIIWIWTRASEQWGTKSFLKKTKNICRIRSCCRSFVPDLRPRPEHRSGFGPRHSSRLVLVQNLLFFSHKECHGIQLPGRASHMVIRSNNLSIHLSRAIDYSACRSVMLPDSLPASGRRGWEQTIPHESTHASPCHGQIPPSISPILHGDLWGVKGPTGGWISNINYWFVSWGERGPFSQSRNLLVRTVFSQ